MSFATDIYTLLTANTAINNAVDGIYFQILPDNESLTGSNIAYQFQLSDNISTLETNNVIDIYDVDLAIVCPDTATLDDIIGHIRAYLDNYDGGVSSKFRDVNMISIDTQNEGERGQFVGSLKYKIFYMN